MPPRPCAPRPRLRCAALHRVRGAAMHRRCRRDRSAALPAISLPRGAHMFHRPPHDHPPSRPRPPDLVDVPDPGLSLLPRTLSGTCAWALAKASAALAAEPGFVAHGFTCDVARPRSRSAHDPPSRLRRSTRRAARRPTQGAPWRTTRRPGGARRCGCRARGAAWRSGA